MDNYPNNSHKARSGSMEPKKVEKVISGQAVRRKKSLGKKFVETFAGDSARSVWGYVLLKVLIPSAKDALADAVSQGAERMLYGEARSSSRRGRKSSATGYVNYSRFSNYSAGRDEPRSYSQRARASHDFDEIILATRAEADEVIDRLFDLLQKYEVVRVSDFYDLVGISDEYTDNKWGWTDLRGASVRRIRDGYLLDLPKPEPLAGA